MNEISRETKQEIINTNNSNITKGTSTSSRSWSGLKDPRIVRVSRTFGGKDRHSKVCTIRGLRDRRVRLSVPTAIQLYDLQDRLGLNQPSKVVDWLLNAAKHEIDELPPLQIPPGAFGQFPQSMVASHGSNDQIQSNSFASLIDAYVRGDSAHPLLQSSTKGGYKIINDMNVVAEDHQHQTTDSKSMYWNLNNSPLRSKNKEVHHDAEETMNDDQRSNWMSKRNKQAAETQEEAAVDDHQVQNSSNAMPAAYNSFYHWDPSNLSLSHLGSSSHGFPSNQGEDNSNSHHNYNVVSMAAPSNTPWSLPSGSHQVLVCPSGATTSIFQPYVTGSNIAHHQQLNHFQMLSTSTSAGSSSSQNLPLNSLTPSLYSIVPNMRPFPLGVVHPKLDDHSQQNNNGGHGL